MKVTTVKWATVSAEERKNLLVRPVSSTDTKFVEKVRGIIKQVKEEKDSALFEMTERYDGVKLDSLRVTRREIETAYEQLKPATMLALKEAIRRVSVFHQAELPSPIDLDLQGIRCQRRFFPIDRVGLYIPGGTAPLPSTVVMLGVPSRIAGCKTRVLLTPPRKDQSVEPSILVAADLLGIQEIFKIGGAQAIAALAYGTESIPKVDKIFGPGNSWVTEAKLQVSQDPEGAACDMPAGPSEVMVIADDSADPGFVAADLLSQAEHGTDSQVILISPSSGLIEQTQMQLDRQLAQLPRRLIASEALSKSLFIQVSRLEDSSEICNTYAPEHLILQVNQARKFSESIRNAGSVFLGPWTPESLGDYASGTNHVLPTYGFARCYSGLGTESFMKSITFQEATLEALREIGPTVEELASTEQLDAHKNAVRIRLKKEFL